MIYFLKITLVSHIQFASHTFTYLEGREREGEGEKEMESQHVSALCWFTPQVPR